MSGKGDKPRPMNIKKETYDERWERIFGNNDERRKREKESDHNSRIRGR